jgi:hypothetical protein
MSWLVKLYPPSWRKRYGGELEDLIEHMPGHVGTELDLLVGATIAYRDVIRANRVLSAAAAYLHGLCVAVLLQAIVFVSLIMAGQRSSEPTEFRLGPFDLATFLPPPLYVRLNPAVLAPDIWVQQVAQAWLPEVVLLGLLGLMLAALLSAPRLLRSLR